MILLLYVTVVSLISTSVSLSCVRCSKSEYENCTSIAEKRRTCEFGVVINICMCCVECGRGPGEDCGHEHERCGQGLTCIAPPPRLIHVGQGSGTYSDDEENYNMDNIKRTCVKDKTCDSVACPRRTDEPGPSTCPLGMRLHIVSTSVQNLNTLRDRCCAEPKPECLCYKSSCPVYTSCPRGQVVISYTVKGQCCDVHHCMNITEICNGNVKCVAKDVLCPSFNKRFDNIDCCKQNDVSEDGCYCLQSMCPEPPECDGKLTMVKLQALGTPDNCCSTYTCQSAKSTVCITDEGDELAHDEVYHPTPCTTCRCDSGEMVCDTNEKCYPPTFGMDPWGNSQCSWLENSADQCCPVCKGCRHMRRDMYKENGAEWSEDNGCQMCSCNEGRVSCITYSCGSLLGCLDVKITPGTCCPSCADSDYKSRISIKAHCISEEFKKCDLNCKFGRVISANGCSKCECRFPVNSTLAKATSFPALLISCRMEDGGFLTDGEKWTDSCNRSCKCISGHILCTLINCPIETLQCRHPIVKLGNCCPTCINESPSTETILPKTSAEQKNAHCNPDTNNKHNTVFKVDICTRCMCTEDDSLMCEEQTCPPLLCHRPIAVEGQCCPICQEDITSDVSLPMATGTCLTSSGAHHATGSVWRVDLCTACYCDIVTATAHCFHTTCSPIVCVRPRFIKGQCCPKCMNDDEVDKLFMNNNQGDRMYYYRVLLMVMAVALMISIIVVAVLLSLMRRRRLSKLRRMSRTPLHTDNASCDLSSTISFLASDAGTKPIYLNNRTLSSQLSEISASIDNVAVESIASTPSSSEQSICKSDANLCDSRVINNDAAKRYTDTSGKEQLRTACAALRRGVVERTHSLVVRIPSITSKDRKINRAKRRSM